jgi:hypothetical protein
VQHPIFRALTYQADWTDMDISFIAIDRFAEIEASKNPAYRERLRKTGRHLLSDARKLSDEDLLGKLQSMSLSFDRESLARYRSESASAEEIFEHLSPQVELPATRNPMERDWLWLSLAVLWERWCPEEPSMEMLDDQIHEGYGLLERGNLSGAVTTWLTAWESYVRIAERFQLTPIDAFDKRFRGTQSIYNWVQDLEMELWNAGLVTPLVSRTSGQ